MIYLLAILLLAAAVNVWATRRLLKADLDGMRRGLFIACVWIVPFMGALMVKDAGQYAAAPAPPETGDDTAREAAPPQLQAGGEPFDVLGHLAQAAGAPLLDWAALQAWADTQPDDAAREAALGLGHRAWLLHLRDALGPHFQLRESPHAYLLSSLDARSATVLLQYVGSTRERIQRVLHGVAQFPPGRKSVLLVLDDEESYYHYVATWYPDEGEFAFSGGMFIDAGCPHFVARRADLSAVEPVIAHEMTHSALAHLRLPRWLDEGMAVNTEHRLAGAAPREHTPQQLQHMHQRFWNAQNIQGFWSGDSFLRTDEGNLLSYDLARILVDQLSRDWPAFSAFITSSPWDDAGVAAARRLLSVDLPASVCAMFGRPADPAWAPSHPAAA